MDIIKYWINLFFIFFVILYVSNSSRILSESSFFLFRPNKCFSIWIFISFMFFEKLFSFPLFLFLFLGNINSLQVCTTSLLLVSSFKYNYSFISSFKFFDWIILFISFSDLYFNVDTTLKVFLFPNKTEISKFIWESKFNSFV